MFQSLSRDRVRSEMAAEEIFQHSSFQLRALIEYSEQFDEIFHEVLSEVSRECGKVVHRIDEDAAELLEIHAWPGDFCELREVLRFAVRKMRTSVLRAQDLPPAFIAQIFLIQESS